MEDKREFKNGDIVRVSGTVAVYELFDNADGGVQKVENEAAIVDTFERYKPDDIPSSTRMEIILTRDNRLALVLKGKITMDDDILVE